MSAADISARTPAAWRPDRDAVADVAPVAVGLVPFALLIGVQISSGPDLLGGWSGSWLLFAGSAQVSALTLLHHGAGLAPVLATVALVNARFAVYGAALAPRFAGQPRWFRLLGPHLIVDQTFALAQSRTDLQHPQRFRRYWLTLGLTVGVVWSVAMAVGVLLGPSVPESPATAFVPVAVFVGILVPALRNNPALFAAATAGLVAAVAPLGPGPRVLCATVCGALVGLALDRRSS